MPDKPGNKKIPATTRALLTVPFEPSLVLVLQAFVDLQEARHQADYDTGRRWNRVDVLRHVEKTREAFAGWADVRKTPNASVLLVAFLLQKDRGR